VNASNQLPGQFLLPGTPDTVKAGYNVQHKLLTSSLTSTATAHAEFILGDNIIIPVLEQPFSRGTIHITNSSTLIQPAINPRYLFNPLDLQVLAEAFNYARTIRSTASLQSISISETFPGSSTTNDTQIETFLEGNSQSIYHHIGTASMLPKHLGGVVDPQLKVYDVEGLRIVDASIMPMTIGAHIQSTVYGIAEKAANLIKADQ